MCFCPSFMYSIWLEKDHRLYSGLPHYWLVNSILLLAQHYCILKSDFSQGSDSSQTVIPAAPHQLAIGWISAIKIMCTGGAQWCYSTATMERLQCFIYHVPGCPAAGSLSPACSRFNSWTGNQPRHWEVNTQCWTQAWVKREGYVRNGIRCKIFAK